MNATKAAAEKLVPEIISRREEIEKLRHLPRDLNDKLIEAGLLRLLVPRDICGLETSPWEFVETVEVLGEADASTGWCAMIAAATCLKSAFLEPEVAQRIYGSVRAVHGGVFAPSGRADVDGDDYVVSGNWMWASGSPNCTWLTGGAVVHVNGEMQKLPNGAPDARQTLFPADQAVLGDDWYVAGLCGTGSGSMTIKDVRIPKSHSVSFVTDKQKMGGALYVFPSFGMLALGIGTVALGNARGAISDLVKLAEGKTPQGTRRPLATRAHSQIQVAEATAKLRGARAYLEDSVGTAWNQANNDGEINIETRAHIRLACTQAARTGAEVCRIMYELGGGTSVFLHSPLQRRFRDAFAATQHMMVAPPTLELTGRVLMGVETDLTFL